MPSSYSLRTMHGEAEAEAPEATAEPETEDTQNEHIVRTTNSRSWFCITLAVSCLLITFAFIARELWFALEQKDDKIGCEFLDAPPPSMGINTTGAPVASRDHLAMIEFEGYLMFNYRDGSSKYIALKPQTLLHERNGKSTTLRLATDCCTVSLGLRDFKAADRRLMRANAMRVQIQHAHKGHHVCQGDKHKLDEMIMSNQHSYLCTHPVNYVCRVLSDIVLTLVVNRLRVEVDDTGDAISHRIFGPADHTCTSQ